MGNVYMEADQVRFKDSTYRNVQEGLAAALEGGGGGGTTVVANPEGSATADLSKLQVGTTIYGIPAEAGDISYDNTSSGLTADDVQEAIDELNTGLSGVTELIPSGATTSNKLATASDIPGTATTLAPGIVQPDGTSITINDGVISAVGGGGSGKIISTSEFVAGTCIINNVTKVLYGKTFTGTVAQASNNLGDVTIAAASSGIAKTCDIIEASPLRVQYGESGRITMLYPGWGDSGLANSYALIYPLDVNYEIQYRISSDLIGGTYYLTVYYTKAS